MLRTLFGEVIQGRLRRLPFLGHWLLLNVLLLVLALAVAFSLGVAERLIAGDLEFGQAPDAVKISAVGAVGLAVVLALFGFAQLNLIAKRVRDMGLPGWLAVLGIIVVASVLSGLWAAEAGGAFHLAIWLALLVIPSDTFT